MPTSSAPQYDLPAYATDGVYVVPGTPTWDGAARRVATGIEAWAAAGATPVGERLAQSENEWLARAQEWSQFSRDEQGTAVYGDGSAGVVTLGAGTTTLAADTYYDDLTVPNGSTLATAGFRVFVAGLLSVAVGGVIHADGGAASGATGGAGAPVGSLGGGTAGANGATDTAPGRAGTVGTSITFALGAQGGAGGIDEQGNAGGAGGTFTAPAASVGGSRHAAAALGYPTGSITAWRGGSGGGSGAVYDGGTAGGGGGGAGVLVLWARRIDNQGTIRANGGAGGNAVVLGSDGVGGGGGGGGGRVFVVHREAVGGTLGTIQVNGGAGGLGGTNQATPPGLDGVAGGTGSIVLLVA